jgi:hypothetical protein
LKVTSSCAGYTSVYVENLPYAVIVDELSDITEVTRIKLGVGQYVKEPALQDTPSRVALNKHHGVFRPLRVCDRLVP